MFIKLLDSDIKYAAGQELEGFRIIRRIGEGRYGICYLVTDNKCLYIFKQLKKKINKINPLKMKYEEEILKALEHKAIPSLIRKVENEQVTGLILEYKSGKTFEHMVFKQKHVFSRKEIYCIGTQLIEVISYLHEKGVVHRDIRIPNTLYDDGHIYLVDFGLARWIDNKKYKADIDYSYLGDFLIHLYYTSFIQKYKKNKSWYEELYLSSKELMFLKKLMGIEKRYKSIKEIELDFEEIQLFSVLHNERC